MIDTPSLISPSVRNRNRAVGSKNQKSPTIQKKKEHSCVVVYIVCIQMYYIECIKCIIGWENTLQMYSVNRGFYMVLAYRWNYKLVEDPVICACILWPYYGYYISLQKIGRIRYSKLAFPSNVSYSSVQWTTSCQLGFKASWRPFLGQKHAKSHSGDHMHGFHCIDVMDTYILTCSSVRYRRQEGL